MTKYLDSAPFMVPPPAKELKGDGKPMYADRFPELVEKPENKIVVGLEDGKEFVTINGVHQRILVDPEMPKDQVKLISVYPPSVVTLVNVGPPEKEEEEKSCPIRTKMEK